MFEILIKKPILITTDKKYMKETPKNNENYQISRIFRISRQISISFQKYIKIYINRKTILSAFYNVFYLIKK